MVGSETNLLKKVAKDFQGVPDFCTQKKLLIFHTTLLGTPWFFSEENRIYMLDFPARVTGYMVNGGRSSSPNSFAFHEAKKDAEIFQRHQDIIGKLT